MIEQTVGWAITAMSLIGVVLNIHHKRSCFIIWGVTNFAWCVIDARHGIYSQAALQAVYLGLSFYGYRKWKEGSK